MTVGDRTSLPNKMPFLSMSSHSISTYDYTHTMTQEGKWHTQVLTCRCNKHSLANFLLSSENGSPTLAADPPIADLATNGARTLIT